MISDQDLRLAVGRALGFGDSFDGTPSSVAELEPQQRELLAIGSVRYIIGRPDEFTAEQVARAKLFASRENFGSLGDYDTPDFLDRTASFFQAYATTAGDFVEGVGGVAGRTVKNLGLNLQFIATAAAVVGVLFLSAPYWLPGVRAALQKVKPPSPPV